jgi:hypothetical protein
MIGFSRFPGFLLNECLGGLGRSPASVMITLVLFLLRSQA